MDDIILSQANKIANGDPDVVQNILAWNYQNFSNAFEKGRVLSIGEQVNFMKHRAGELRSGIRRDFGHGGYHANEDVHCKNLYYNGEVEIVAGAGGNQTVAVNVHIVDFLERTFLPILNH